MFFFLSFFSFFSHHLPLPPPPPPPPGGAACDWHPGGAVAGARVVPPAHPAGHRHVLCGQHQRLAAQVCSVRICVCLPACVGGCVGGWTRGGQSARVCGQGGVDGKCARAAATRPHAPLALPTHTSTPAHPPPARLSAPCTHASSPLALWTWLAITWGPHKGLTW